MSPAQKVMAQAAVPPAAQKVTASVSWYEAQTATRLAQKVSGRWSEGDGKHVLVGAAQRVLPLGVGQLVLEQLLHHARGVHALQGVVVGWGVVVGGGVYVCVRACVRASGWWVRGCDPAHALSQAVCCCPGGMLQAWARPCKQERPAPRPPGGPWTGHGKARRATRGRQGQAAARTWAVQTSASWLLSSSSTAPGTCPFSGPSPSACSAASR